MKRVALLLSAMFMFGCGAGGETTTTSSSNTGGSGADGSNTGNNTNAALGGFTLNLVESVSKTAARSTVVAGIPPVANSVRIIARRFGSRSVEIKVYDGATDSEVSQDPPVFVTVDDVEIYKKVMDIPYTPGSPVTVNLPVADGYTIDILTNRVDIAGKHVMLKYGAVTPVNISDASSSASVTMHGFSDTTSPLVDIQAAPDPITSEENYLLTVSAAKPIKLNYKIRQDLSNIAFVNYSSKKFGNLGSPTSFKAPTSYVDGQLYFQGLFTIDSQMLSAGESDLNWTRVYPNPNYGESVSCDLKKVIAGTFNNL